VVVRPGDEAAGTGRYNSVRASHADRDRVIDLLKAAFVQGRLAKDEFDLRVGRVLASRTYADLDALTADIPAALLRPQLPEPARETASAPAGESTQRKIVKAWACATVVLPSMAVGVALLKSGTAVGYIAIAMALFACVVAVPVSGLLILHSWIEKRCGNAWDEPGGGESGATG
jgi:hypothetical protein